MFDLLKGSRRLGQVTLSDVELIITESDVDQPTDRPRNKPATKSEPFKLPPSLSGTLTINNVKATYQPIDSESIQLTLDQDEVRITDLRDIAFDFDAKLQQGVKQGRVSLKGDVLNLFDPDGFEQAGRAAYDITLDVQDVPTAAIDQVVSGMNKGIKPGRVVALLGDGELVSNMTVKGTIEQLTSDLTMNTPKLRVGLKQRMEGQTLIAAPEDRAPCTGSR